MKAHAAIAPVKCLCILILALSPGPPSHAADFAGGTGTPDDPYQVATAEQLVAIGSDPNLLDKCFMLVDDIDLSRETINGKVLSAALIAPNLHMGWAPRAPAFTGRFNGNGYEVRNLTIHGTQAGNLGLFGSVGEGGHVLDLRIVNASITGPAGSFGLGGLTGYSSGQISDCHVSCQVTAGNRSYYVGGLVGHNWGGTVVDCSVDCQVSGGERSRYLGGLIGQNSWGCVAQSWARGQVSGGRKSADLGGMVGYSTADARIVNSLAEAHVIGASESRALGGLVGAIDASVIVNCYATGQVHGGENVGGLVGYNDEGIVNECFWDVDTSGLEVSAGGVGLTTVQMQDFQTFLLAGWDLTGEYGNGTADLWLMPEAGGYPTLMFFSDSYQAHPLKGAGKRDDPYQIATPEDLGAMSHYDRSACYRLAADIDLSRIIWSTAPIVGFDGSFDGAGSTISSLTMRGRGYLALFDVLDAYAVVENLGISDCLVIGGDDSRHLAGLVGLNWGRVSNCFVKGHIIAGDGSSRLGVLAGESSGEVNDCHVSGNVSTGHSSIYVGGFGGWCAGSRIENCYALATVTRGHNCLGVGGFAGSDWESYGPTVINNCYFLSPADGGGPDNGIGTPLLDIQMKQKASFAGWDFETAWMICEGQGYPRLQWEGILCDE